VDKNDSTPNLLYKHPNFVTVCPKIVIGHPKFVIISLLNLLKYIEKTTSKNKRKTREKLFKNKLRKNL